MHRLHLVVTLALLPVTVATGSGQEVVKSAPLKDLPPVWRGKEKDSYRVDPYIAAAMALQAEPKSAGDTLKKMVDDAGERGEDEKALILCRMLFTARPKGKFRRPALGAPTFLGGGDYKEWPLEPIEVVDGVPFLVVFGYSGGGRPESASNYLSYCLKECDWIAAKYAPKDKEAKEKALAMLLADKRWKEGLAKSEKEILSSQLK